MNREAFPVTLPIYPAPSSFSFRRELPTLQNLALSSDVISGEPGFNATTVTFDVADDNENSVTADVTVNGETVACMVSGSAPRAYSCDYVLTSPPGSNSNFPVAVTVQDGAGNLDGGQLTLQVDVEPPQAVYSAVFLEPTDGNPLTSVTGVGENVKVERRLRPTARLSRGSEPSPANLALPGGGLVAQVGGSFWTPTFSESFPGSSQAFAGGCAGGRVNAAAFDRARGVLMAYGCHSGIEFTGTVALDYLELRVAYDQP